MKALVGAFNQEKALVGAFFVIVQPVVEPMDRFTALHVADGPSDYFCSDINKTIKHIHTGLASGSFTH